MNFNRLDKDLPGVVIINKTDKKCYNFSEAMYFEALTGDTDEEFKNEYKD